MHSTNSYFSGGAHNDEITIINGYGNIVEGGAGQDTYRIQISNKISCFSLTIDNSTADSYKDLLVISDKTNAGYYTVDSFWDDFNFTKNDDGDLFITGRTFDAEIVIKDWDNHPMSQISFEGHRKTEVINLDGNSIDKLVSQYPETQSVASALLSFNSSSELPGISSSDVYGVNNNEADKMFVTGNV